MNSCPSSRKEKVSRNASCRKTGDRFDGRAHLLFWARPTRGEAYAQQIDHGLIQGYIGPDHRVMDMQSFYSALVQALQAAHQQGWKESRRSGKPSDEAIAAWAQAEITYERRCRTSVVSPP